MIMSAVAPESMASDKQFQSKHGDLIGTVDIWTIGNEYGVILGCLVHTYKQCIHFTTLKPAFLLIEERYTDQKTADPEM